MTGYNGEPHRSQRIRAAASPFSVGGLMIVAAIAALVFVPATGAASGVLSQPSVSLAPSTVPSSVSAAQVTSATVVGHADSLRLASPGVLNLFAMADGAGHPSTGFSTGNIVTAIAFSGYPVAAIAATPAAADHYTTSDSSYCIGGAGVSGFQYYGEKTKVLIPPVPTESSTLSEKLVLPESALVVVVALSGGHDNTIALSGVPGLVIDAEGTGDWTCAMIGHAFLTTGTYTVTETETLESGGGPSGGDVIGIFAFANTVNGFIHKPAPS